MAIDFFEIRIASHVAPVAEVFAAAAFNYPGMILSGDFCDTVHSLAMPPIFWGSWLVSAVGLPVETFVLFEIGNGMGAGFLVLPRMYILLELTCPRGYYCWLTLLAWMSKLVLT